MKQDKEQVFKAHFSSNISAELMDYVRNEMMIDSRYFFVERVTRGLQKGTCSHCKSQHLVKSDSTLKHNDVWQCEKCLSPVLVKSSGRGRGQLIDRGYVVWYEKSLVDPEAITATGYYIDMDYTEVMTGKMSLLPVARYVFEKDKATMMHRSYYLSGSHEEGWKFTKKSYTMIGKKSSYSSYSTQAIESFKKAIEGTQFVYSGWEYLFRQNVDLVRFLAVYVKRPFVEYLLKMGMESIVNSMVEEWSLYNCLNYRGKDLKGIVGLNKKELKDWKASGVEMTPILLSTYKWFRKRGVTLSWEQTKKCGNLISGSHYKEKLTRLMEITTLKEIVKYSFNQLNKSEIHFYDISLFVNTWTDYLDECQMLGIDTALSKNLFPNDLRKAHKKTAEAIKYKEDEEINRKIRNQQTELQHLNFESNNLFIRPALSSKELFEEGKKLEHCVRNGEYAKRFANKKIAILFLRKKEDPDTPFYTVEISREFEQVTQCQGFDNAHPTKEVEDFMNIYKKVIANRRKERKVAL